MAEKLIDAAAKKINLVRKKYKAIVDLLWVLRGLAITFLCYSVWLYVLPQQALEGLVISIFLLVLILMIDKPKVAKSLNKTELQKALESTYSDTNHPVQSLESSHSFTSPTSREWHPIFEEIENKNAANGLLVARKCLWGLLIASALLAIQFSTFPPRWEIAMQRIDGIIRNFTKGARLVVVNGAAEVETSKPISIPASETPVVRLLSRNLVRFEIKGAPPGKPSILLKKGDTVYQSFQMSPIFDADSGQPKKGEFEVSFAVEKDLEMVVPSIKGNQVLAKFEVKRLPVPIVSLKPISKITDPWHDDKPLLLKINAESRAPLKVISLIIKTGKRESRELVSNIMTNDKKEVETEYTLILESYVESDIAEVEIVAEAIDQAVPSPLVGYSKPLKVRTASAYGRYQQALQTLREVKMIVDDDIDKQEESLSQEDKLKTADRAEKQAANTPFFDGLDRYNIANMVSTFKKLQKTPNFSESIALQSELNQFLFEHEMLDHRERDRDFFVAARTLSRVLEQEVAKRPVEGKVVTERIKNYLQDRRKYWEIRANRIPDETRPPEWEDIKNQKPFLTAMEKIGALSESDQGTSDALGILSKTVSNYRNWIEKLEAAEENSRQQQEQKRQQGLANARNQLRELQVQQGKISEKLDKAAKRDKKEISENWPTTRMKQKANESKTGRLEGQMRSLSPQASGRIKAAQEAMQKTIEAGDAKNFVEAESFSDIAGRLLRQASKDTQRSQRKRGRANRRRRVAGDNYYGQSVVGGDVEIKREYKVDRKYREDILDEVSRSGSEAEDRVLMENYLRRVVR